VAELKGDFKRAEKHFRKLMRKGVHARGHAAAHFLGRLPYIRRHVAAVTAGHRWASADSTQGSPTPAGLPRR
jgi:hypothetical protein